MLPIPADIFTEPDDVSNTLQRIGAPVLNPLAAILKDRADKASERP